uniref:Uncharacterized protein n=1 Tax=Clastoptera arizonana TaxID=38151 RepID=A0A1B6C876_9HEMI
MMNNHSQSFIDTRFTKMFYRMLIRIISRRSIFKIIQMAIAFTGLYLHATRRYVKSFDSYVLIPASFGAGLFTSSGLFLGYVVNAISPSHQDTVFNAMASTMYGVVLTSMMNGLPYISTNDLFTNVQVLSSLTPAFGLVFHLGDSVWEIVNMNLKELQPIINFGPTVV